MNANLISVRKMLLLTRPRLLAAMEARPVNAGRREFVHFLRLMKKARFGKLLHGIGATRLIGLVTSPLGSDQVKDLLVWRKTLGEH